MAHSLVWLSTEDIIQKVPCTCIDGRTRGLRYSVAGGSFGLILHTLARIQRSGGQVLDDLGIEAYLVLFAGQVGPVYMHSDQHTLDCIYSRQGLPPDTRLRDLSPEQQRSFSELATLPDLQGCGHLKLMLQNEDKYGVPAELIRRSQKAFLRLYFQGVDNVMFDVLSGRHQEEQVVLLETQTAGDARHSALYLDATQAEHRFFCHRPLKQALIERFLTALDDTALPGLPRTEWPALVAEHNAAAERTLERLAPDLPVDHIHL